MITEILILYCFSVPDSLTILEASLRTRFFQKKNRKKESIEIGQGRLRAKGNGISPEGWDLKNPIMP